MEDLNYQKAFEELQHIIKSMQEEMTSIDELAEQSRRAAFLIKFCQEKLRKTEEEINSLFDSND